MALIGTDSHNSYQLITSFDMIFDSKRIGIFQFKLYKNMMFHHNYVHDKYVNYYDINLMITT